MTTKLANELKKHVADKQFVDIGGGAAEHFSSSKENFRTTIGMLKSEGYRARVFRVIQDGTGLESRVTILTPPDFDQNTFHKIAKDVFKP